MTRAIVLTAVLSVTVCASTTIAGEGIDARVLRVLDGDTIVVQIDGEPARVRLLGVNAPETQRRQPREDGPGEASRRALAGLVASEAVVLHFDSHQRRTDAFDRTLAYVIRSRDALFVNGEMIRLGHARVIYGYALDRLAELRRLEADARAARRGLWAGSENAALRAETGKSARRP